MSVIQSESTSVKIVYVYVYVLVLQRAVIALKKTGDGCFRDESSKNFFTSQLDVIIHSVAILSPTI